jgi:hypothetical protein
MERLESLATKLGHGLPAVRGRAASNLVFKLSREDGGSPGGGGADGSLLGSSHCVSVLVTHLQPALSACLARRDGTGDGGGGGGGKGPSADPRGEDDYLRNLLALLKAVGRCPAKEGAAASTLSKALSTLYEMSTRSDMAAHTQGIAEAIEAICSVNADMLSAVSEQRQRHAAIGPSSTASSSANSSFAASGAFSVSASPGPVRPLGQGHGAGCILDSPLSSAGWSFPRFALTDADERYLFDAEVKLKMSQEGVQPLLMDLLADFPGQSLLTRSGLLGAVLDVLGTPYLSSSSGLGGDGGLASSHPQGADGNGHLTPLGALDWLARLLDKLTAEHALQLEGLLASGYACPRRSGEGEIGVPGPNTALRMVSDLCFVCLLLQIFITIYVYLLYLFIFMLYHLPLRTHTHTHTLTHTHIYTQAAVMHAYRYPQISPAPCVWPEAGAEGQGQGPSLEGQGQGRSLTGIAFAISAAVMPLLRSRDVCVCAGALSLLRTSLPLCLEPLWALGGEDALSALLAAGVSEEAAEGARATAAALCSERLQHLLSRLEQVYP